MSAALPSGEIKTWRVNLLRIGYLIILLGMGSQIVPTLLTGGPWEIMEGAVNAMMFALVVLCLVGLRHPLKMLSVLFWEIIWKLTWMVTVALPAMRSGGMDDDQTAMAFACALVVVIITVIPWDYVWRNYVRAKGARWF